uniref:MFS14 protein n=2 Tax=Zea mays TaxID=4577 RepID=MFS14_MAIZE|nr:RecName: Full=MFS14 protein; Flags: Precursor [Zea mays]CAA47737.1 MSF14 [Zea mays]CAB76921.1 hypothetical protein [Zea mays]
MALEAATAPRALLAACLVLLVLGGGTGPSSVLRAPGRRPAAVPAAAERLLRCRAYLVPARRTPARTAAALSAVCTSAPAAPWASSTACPAGATSPKPTAPLEAGTWHACCNGWQEGRGIRSVSISQ